MKSKFFNRNLKTGRTEKKAAGLTNALDVLMEANYAWLSLEDVRKKARRSVMYSHEDQWGDLIKDPNDGNTKTESRYIMDQGKQPLKNNMIKPIIKNIDGQFRSSTTKPVCVVRDQRESKLGEMMSVAIEYIHEINEMQELDANSLNSLMNTGFTCQRVEYGFNPSKQDMNVWVYGSNPFRVFFNSNIEDPRAWDLNLIGEIFDIPLKDVYAQFSKSSSDKEKIASIYGHRLDAFYAQRGMQGDQNKNMTFFNPSRLDLCRVILVWKKETRECYFCQDELEGKWWYSPFSDKGTIDAINAQRLYDAKLNGVEEEDVLLIKYEYSVEQYWYYRYMSPAGDVLQEGRSPYWHKEHNYVLHIYPMLHGKIYNFIEDFIDQQRSINRTMTLIDFIRGAAAKGLLVVDADAFEGMSREKIVDEYVRFNGVLFAKMRNGINLDNVIKQYNGQASVAGDYELLNIQLRLINEISGVNSAMQGKAPTAGTPSALYAQQVQNSALNLRGLLDSFKSFRLKRTSKVMKTAQQYYTSARYIDLAGTDYDKESKWYDPDKVQDADIDVSLSEGTNTPAYQMLMNDMLMELFKANAIDVKKLLENSSLPFASRILESIKRDEEAMKEQGLQGMQGIPPELMQQANQAAPMLR